MDKYIGDKIMLELRGVVGQEKIYNASIAVAYVCYLAKTEIPNSMLSFDYRTIIERIDEPIVKNFLIKNLDNISNDVYNLFFSFNKEILESIIMDSKPESYRDCVEYTPDFIIDLANKILQIEKDDIVNDICTGIGTYIFKTYNNFPQARYIGYEINSDLVAILKLKSFIIQSKSNRSSSDFNVSIINKDILKDEIATKADKAFMHMPFGLRANFITNFREIKSSTPLLSSLKRSSSLDWAFIAYLLKSIKKDGMAIALTTVGTTFNLIDTTFREYFVKNGFLKAVISLPDKLMTNTSVKTILYVFSSNSESVKMIDASDVYVNERRQNVLSNENIEEIYDAYLKDGALSKTVSLQEIEANDYILLPNRYLTSISFKNGVKLSDFLTVNRGAPLKASELDELSTIKQTGKKYLMLSDISDGLIDDELHNITEIDASLENYIINENNLILSKIGSPFKVAILNNRDSKILANGNLYILKVDETKANPYYIQAFLQSDLGQKVLESKAKGVQFSSISKGDLLDIEIPLPPIEEQNRIGESLKNSLNQIVDLSKKLKKEKIKIASLFNMKSTGFK